MLKLHDLVKDLNVSEGTIRSWTKKGILPDRRDRFGRRVFMEEDLKKIKDSIIEKKISESNPRL